MSSNSASTGSDGNGRRARRFRDSPHPDSMLGKVLATDLKDDSVIETYREYHRRVWPEVLESLRASGVLDLQIYLLGRRLVMIAELEDGADLRRAFATRMASHPRVA